MVAFLSTALEETKPGGEWSRLFGRLSSALLALPLLVCMALTLLAAYIDGSSFNDVVLLPPERVESVRFVVGVLAYITGYLTVYFVPGLLLMRSLRIDLPNSVSNAIAAFVLSLAGVSLVWILTMTLVTGGGNRTLFYMAIAGLETLTIVAIWAQSHRRPLSPWWPDLTRGDGRELFILAVGVLLMLTLGCLLMPGKITLEALEGDATEIHGFAVSLFRVGLPEWDLEVGAWGFYPTFMFVSYPVFFSLALGGISEAAVRLPALLFLGIMILAMVNLAGRSKVREADGFLLVLLPILVTGYLSLQVGAYYANYDPLHGDLAAAPIVEWLVTALAMSGVVLIHHESPGLGAIAAFLSIIAFPSGLMLVVLLGTTGFLVATSNERRVLVKCGLLLLALLAVYSLFVVIYASAHGTFEPMIREWISKYFAGRAEFGSESSERMLRALWWYVLLAGGLPAVGYVLALFSRDWVARWLALTGVLWVGFFMFSPNKHIHYFMPAALIPVVLAIRVGLGLGVDAQTGREKEKREESNAGWRALVWMSLLTLSGIVVIILSWPKAVPTYTADREFGRKTVFVASTEREAVEDSVVLYNVVKPLTKWKASDPWTTGHHTWVRYADRTLQPSRRYDFYVGRNNVPVEGLQEISRTQLADGGYAFLWARNGRSVLHEWEKKFFPLKKDLSRFNFDLDPLRWN